MQLKSTCHNSFDDLQASPTLKSAIGLRIGDENWKTRAMQRSRGEISSRITTSQRRAMLSNSASAVTTPFGGKTSTMTTGRSTQARWRARKLKTYRRTAKGNSTKWPRWRMSTDRTSCCQHLHFFKALNLLPTLWHRPSAFKSHRRQMSFSFRTTSNISRTQTSSRITSWKNICEDLTMPPRTTTTMTSRSSITIKSKTVIWALRLTRNLSSRNG